MVSIVAIKLVAWGVGGTLFGVLTDRFGRARIMLITIVIYALFTGLSARRRTGCSWRSSRRSRAWASAASGRRGRRCSPRACPSGSGSRLMIIMQLAFSVGYFFAAVVNLAVGAASWRWVLVWCAMPALLVIVLRLFVKEPEQWVRVQQSSGQALGSLRRLFEPDLRRRTLGGFFSAMTLMVGSFAATTFVPSWIGSLSVGGPAVAAQNASYFAMLLNGGAIIGYIVLIWLTASRIGRRGSYFVFCARRPRHRDPDVHPRPLDRGVLWLAPVAGFFMLGGFGVFAVWLPELFPTAVRATGQGFCFNFARVITGVGTLTTGCLVGSLGSFPMAGLIVSLVFALGLFTIWIGPETRGWRLSDVVTE